MFSQYPCLKLFLACIAGFMLMSNAHAQNTSLEDRVLREFSAGQRVPSDYEPKGLNFRGFELRPVLVVEGIYNDNIFATEQNADADFYTKIMPSLTISKPYGPHFFDLNLSGDFRRYMDITNENSNNYSLSTTGYLEAISSLSFQYELGRSREALARSEPGDASFTTKPLNVLGSRGSFSGAYRFNRLELSLIGNLSRLIYNDGENADTGEAVIGRDRNRTDKEAVLRATYDVMGQNDIVPEHVLFAEVNYKQQRFDNVPNKSGTVTADQRDNDESGILLGLNTRYKGLISGRAAIGYFTRKFDQSDDVSRLNYDLDLSMNVTPKFTAFLSGNRTINQDNAFVTGIVRTTGELSGEYELLHNLYAGGLVSYTNSDFTGERDGREDNDLTFGLNLRYLHSPYFQSRLKFETISRDSNEIGEDFDRNVIMYSLTSQY